MDLHVGKQSFRETFEKFYQDRTFLEKFVLQIVFRSKYSCINKTDYNCIVCDKIINIKSKSVHLQSLTRKEVYKCVRIKHTIQNPDFFEKEYIFN